MAAGLMVMVSASAAVADEGSPGCHAFTPHASYVEQTIVMSLENGRVPLRVPVQYFEDRWDRVDGVEDTSQLFSVDMDDWTQVTRPDTAVRNREGRTNYMWFTVGDSVPLDRVALLTVQGLDPVAPAALPPGRPGPAGLTWLETARASDTARPETDIFVVYNTENTLLAILECDAPLRPMTMNPLCQHSFRAAGMDVRLSYRRISIDRWRELQDDVTAFLTCATTPAL